MVPHVLGVGYAYNEYEVTAGRWKEFEIEFDYADNIKQAAAMLSFKEYICVAICSDVIPQDDLDILRQKRAVPIIVVPPSYSEEQRYACVHFGAAQYLHTYNHPMVEMFSEKNSMRNCLKIPKAYLTTEYRPLGRLKSRDQFSDDAQYQVHYDAIMSSGYANEITDFRARESSLSKAGSSFMVWLGAVIAAAALLVFNLIMSKRGCEKVYFRKHCLPKGQDVKSYYSISFVLELLLSVVLFGALLFLRINLSKEYIPGSAIGFKIAIVPAAMVIAEIICLAMNKSMVSELTKQVEAEMRKKKQQEEKIRNESESEDEDDQIQEKTKTSN